MAKTEKLLALMNERISALREDSKGHKQLHRRYQYASIGLTVLSATLGGLALYEPAINKEVNLAIVVASAAIAAIASLDGLRKPAQMWVHERVTYYRLIDLKREIEFKTESTISESEIDDYFERFQIILSASADTWHNNIVKPSANRKDTTVKT